MKVDRNRGDAKPSRSLVFDRLVEVFVT